tara:strand:- start:95 stop:394 length:300 start_codon:yes stop_codon:yes gene_type:complete
MFVKQQLVILELLDENRKWWYGLELVKASDGKLGRGTIYTWLSSLIEQGFVKSREENDEEFDPQHPRQLRRTLYRITEDGIDAKSEQQRTGLTLAPEPA